MDNQIMPDSLATAAPVATPVAQAPQTDTTGAVDASSQVDTQAKTTELATLEKRLADTSEALKTVQTQFHEQKGQLAQMNTQIGAQNQPEAPTDILQSEDFLKRFDDDPAKGLAEAMNFERDRLSKAFVEVMDERDKQWETRLSSQFALAPEKQAYAAEMAELGTSIEGFDALPDATKIQMAKAIRSATGVETLTPPGNPAGSGYSEAQRQTAEATKKAETLAMVRNMFGNDAQPGQEMYPTVGDIGSQYKPVGA